VVRSGGMLDAWEQGRLGGCISWRKERRARIVDYGALASPRAQGDSFSSKKTAHQGFNDVVTQRLGQIEKTLTKSGKI